PPLPTPLPLQTAAEIPTEQRWMTEVGVDEWAAARNRRLGPTIFSAGAYDENHLRCGSDGAGYHCPHFMIQGGASLEASTVRPPAPAPRHPRAAGHRARSPGLAGAAVRQGRLRSRDR